MADALADHRPDPGYRLRRHHAGVTVQRPQIPAASDLPAQVDGARAGRGAAVPLERETAKLVARRHDARRGAAARAARDRRRRAGQGRMPRGSWRRRARIHGPGRALRSATASAEARLRSGRRERRSRWASAPIPRSSRLIDAVLLRMLPIDDPAGLQLVIPRQTNGDSRGFEYPEFRRLRAANPVFVDVAAYGTARLNVSLDGSVEPTAEGQLVSGSYFPLLGVNAVAGRTIGPEDDVNPNGHPVAVISHGYWKRRFGLEPSVVGRTIHLSGTPFTIIGVAPREFFGLEVGRAPDIWVPIMMQPTVMPAAENWLGEHMSRTFWLTVVGRLKPEHTRTTGASDRGRPGRALAHVHQAGQSRRAPATHSRTAGTQPGGNRDLEPAPAVFAAAPHPDGRRRSRPPDCLRQCRQPGARPRGVAIAGILDAPRARRRPLAARPPAARRERDPCDRSAEYAACCSRDGRQASS